MYAMKLIAITQRVSEISEYAEWRDQLDQRWTALLSQAGYHPLLVPNHAEVALELVQRLQPNGIIFTGGNDLVKYGGESLARDKTEQTLLKYAIEKTLPVLGVCRGMQLIQDYYQTSLIDLEGHVMPHQEVMVCGQKMIKNSYHTLGTRQNTAHFSTFATSKDQVVKGIKHQSLPILGIMWHPEREHPFAPEDVKLINRHFK
ncbi:gamma-glutamyl-gamma-aminobutyrate hydrolase family protein [Pseudoalteromonas sp. OOF1S-7]|uniref:gamma-glutamyl-gamma-aminobutyrate hydrolase family protein n=1 Tax=Pseudoalteromonas sp. OOF1S-7 TaxID=2917757 RepID=UPI001EF490E3|nr:gamma-glutamyl-gamma-aminobutyrate hydrolase family protein [Pseudoalteromonas sp. OOF1S-7]MCG7537134.1 gamma-glutamyl-gamma-aminobutyrate hydrolase family protein [Pseudoalteromonas sp. OOF1S-7]